MNNCLYCKSDSLQFLTENEAYTYKGKTVQRPVEFTHCENCGREYIFKQQILKNEAVVRDVKKSIDGLLTSEEIKQTRIQLKLTQEQARKVFGGGKNAFSKYERGEVAQSAAMDKLIRVCLDYPAVFRDLMAKVGISAATIIHDYEDNDNIIEYPIKSTSKLKATKHIDRVSKKYA